MQTTTRSQSLPSYFSSPLKCIPICCLVWSCLAQCSQSWSRSSLVYSLLALHWLAPRATDKRYCRVLIKELCLCVKHTLANYDDPQAHKSPDCTVITRGGGVLRRRNQDLLANIYILLATLIHALPHNYETWKTDRWDMRWIDRWSTFQEEFVQ